ncbi:hypothetical protein [Synechococcus phage S-H34]|uniref:Uncharacterized protein n=1 Tax=Synechococcus phage S-H34 TaxID=2718942 RepID=A0A6G8R6E1_9CAUD|nr:hypothetical protein PQC15_gp074 [Synechococcus phage S-H34]QIN96945.1 hypothetical protein [Synechococcus phage S-H34]
MTTIRCFIWSLLMTLAAALLAVLIVISSPLSAHALLIPSELQSLPEAVERAGIEVRVNDSNVCGKQALGVYFPGRDLIVVCQSVAQPGDSEYQWSSADFTVLMHESTHLLQDCLSGSLRDMQLVPINQTREELERYSKELSDEQVAWIIETYTEAGADDLTLWLEVEAFSTQTSVEPATLTEKILNTCPIRN